ncbi:MAG: ComEA family DNA-binding protein [Chlorobium sp.]
MMFAIVLAFPLCSSLAFCGENDDLQKLLDKAESEVNIERLLELTDELKKNKIALNEADPDELHQLPWLKSTDVQALVDWRREHGTIHSLHELESVLGKEKTASIAPYVRLQPERTLRKTLTPKAVEVDGSLYSRLFWETTPRKGILNGKYAGENYKLYHRAEFSVPHIKASLVQEKDIGEPDRADFTSFSINAYDLGLMKSAVLGSYKLNFAQGLLIGQGRYVSKGADPTGSVQLFSKQILPYSSSSEFGFFQGAATTLQLDPLDVTLFYSANHLDAIINSSGVITSFSTSGYHRTELEISRKDNIVETLSGANILYHYQTGIVGGKVGGSVLHYGYALPFDELEPNTAVSTLSSSTLYGLETDLSFRKLGLFAEAAFSRAPEDASWTAGAEYELLHGITTVAALRRYGVNYFSPFAGAFAERGSGASNEHGYYIGVNAKVSDRLAVGAYYDRFTFPVLGSNSPYPSDGNDSRLFVTWKQSPLLAWSMQVQHKYKEEQKNQGTSKIALWTPLPQITNRCQLDCDITVSGRVHSRTRGEVKSVVKEYLAGDQPFYGRMLYQQVVYNAGNYGLKGRFTVFDTNDYDAAIYAYEDDLPLTSSLGVYDGQGKSLFLVATWKAMKQMKLGARYEKTWYSDREVCGSGNDERATSAPGSFHLGCLLSF